MLAGLDSSILAWLHHARSPLLDTVFMAVTWLGSLWVLLPLGMLPVLWQWWCGWRRHSLRQGWAVLASVCVASVAAVALKAGFGRERPALFEAFTPMPADAAFPSAHAAQVAAFALAFWWWLPARQRGWAGIALLLLAGVVMLSRLYLQVHWPSDVLAGASLGIASAVAVRVLIGRGMAHAQ